MTPIGFVLVIVGLGAVIVGGLRIRGPLAAYRRLQDTQANLRRYDDWRGSRVGSASGPTGADEMMRQLRQQVVMWGGVMGVGAVLVLAGLLLR
jgi:hypothetical protein